MQDVNHLYPNVENVLKELKENGHLCFVATGRGYSSIPSALKNIMDGFITLTGAGCIYNGKSIISHRIPKESIDQLAKLAFSIGAPMLIQNDEKVDLVISPVFDYEDVVWEMDPYVDDYYRSFEEYSNSEVQICKVDTRTQFLDEIKKLPSVSNGNLKTLDSGDGWLEILLSNIDKGTAIRELCKMIGHNIRNTICFGDSENDLAMFDVCDISIAVSNAMDEVKKKASIVLDGNNQDAVIRVLQNLNLLSK